MEYPHKPAINTNSMVRFVFVYIYVFIYIYINVSTFPNSNGEKKITNIFKIALYMSKLGLLLLQQILESGSDALKKNNMISVNPRYIRISNIAEHFIKMLTTPSEPIHFKHIYIYIYINIIYIYIYITYQFLESIGRPK